MKFKKALPFAVIAVIVIAIAVALTIGNTGKAQAAFLEKYELANLDVKAVVSKLDSTIEEPAELSSSITGTQLTLTDGKQTVKLDLPKDEFYLSFAPYLTQTHPCAMHSPSSCRGELVNVPVQTKITDSKGAVIVDETLTSMANGFIGVWLPKGIDATIQVNYGGKTATAPISTRADSETCLTTPMKLN